MIFLMISVLESVITTLCQPIRSDSCLTAVVHYVHYVVMWLCWFFVEIRFSVGKCHKGLMSTK